MGQKAPDNDWVDIIAADWARERPDVDIEGLNVIGRISRLSRYLERAIETTFEAHRLNSAGFYVLAALRRSEPPHRLSPTELYSSLLVSSGAMTNRLDRLEESGLVRRVPDAVDGRSSLVALTSKGRALTDKLIERHAANEVRLLSALSAQERAVLAGLLRKLLLGFDDRPRPSRPADSEPEVAGSRGGKT